MSKCPAKKKSMSHLFFGGLSHKIHSSDASHRYIVPLHIAYNKYSLVGNTEDQMCIFPELYLKIVNSQIQFYNLRSHMQMQSVLLLTHLWCSRECRLDRVHKWNSTSGFHLSFLHIPICIHQNSVQSVPNHNSTTNKTLQNFRNHTYECMACKNFMSLMVKYSNGDQVNVSVFWPIFCKQTSVLL